MQKSADAFRTISEVAEDLTLPQHVLRFWETRFPQIRPLKRAGGRRYYRPADIVLLKTIRQLLYDDGYTIKGVQRLLKEQGPKGLVVATAPDLDVPGEEEPPVEHQLPAAANDLGPAPLAKAAWNAPQENRADVIVAASTPELPVSSAAHRASLVEAVETIDECLRILLGVRRPS